MVTTAPIFVLMAFSSLVAISGAATFVARCESVFTPVESSAKWNVNDVTHVRTNQQYTLYTLYIMHGIYIYRRSFCTNIKVAAHGHLPPLHNRFIRAGNAANLFVHIHRIPNSQKNRKATQNRYLQKVVDLIIY